MKRIISYVLVFTLCFCAFGCFAYADTTDSSSGSSSSSGGSEETYTEVLRVSASDTSGLHAIILSLIGDYNPVVKDYTYQSSSGYTSHSIEITPDWSWICTAALFIVVVYCTFKFIGGIFTK